MSGLQGILELAKRSLGANQYGISVVSHNIANASSPGYSRQRVELTTSTPQKMLFGYLGTGVDVKTVRRLREGYIDQQMYSVNHNLGQATQRQQILQLAESFFQEPSDSGLNAMMGKFFGSFQDLSLHPEESSTRNAVFQRAKLMTETFHRISDSLTTLETDILNDTQTKVNKINALIKTIAGLDVNVTNAMAQGLSPNDIKDQRDQSVAELSKLVNLNVTEDQRGSLSISIAGTSMISNGNYTQLTSSVVGGSLTVTAQGSNVPVNVTSGELGGDLTLYNNSLPTYMNKLDQIAQTLISQVNAVHSTGFGIGNPPPTGNNFFTGTNAKNIALDPAIVSNISNIAASKDGAPGNNEIALVLAKLKDQLSMNGNTNTVSQFYNGIVSGMGSEIQTMQTESESHNLVLQQLDTQQKSVAGVSLDEEMTNLIKFQQGFAAAARVINTVDEMFDTLINMV